jgi:protein-tyrosine phosphatase
LDERDADALARLGIRTVYDLRTERERQAAPDRELPGARSVVIDVLADAADAAPAELEAVRHHPQIATSTLGDGQAAAMFTGGYRRIVSSGSALSAYRTMFTDLATDLSRPALFHCTTGKDRTGWAAAVLLMLLGSATRT